MTFADTIAYLQTLIAVLIVLCAMAMTGVILALLELRRLQNAIAKRDPLFAATLFVEQHTNVCQTLRDWLRPRV